MVTQWINILLLVSESWVVFRNMRKRMHYYLFVNCMFMLLCSTGSLLMFFVETEEAVFISFLLSWAGKVGVVVSMFFFCIKLCESKLPVIITAIESGFAVITYHYYSYNKKNGVVLQGFPFGKRWRFDYFRVYGRSLVYVMERDDCRCYPDMSDNVV